MKLQLLTLFLALVAILSGCNQENSKTNTAPTAQNTPSAKVEPVTAKEAAKDTKTVSVASNLSSAQDATKAKDDVSATPKSVTDNWYNYTAKDGTYSVKFPEKPQEQQQTLNSKIGKLNQALVLYEDKVNNQGLMTASMKVPVKPRDFNVEQGLKGAVDNVASNNTVLTEKKITYKDKGFPGREITMQNKDGLYGKQRIYVDPSGPTLYQAIVVSKSKNLDSPEATAFLDSLTIK